MAMVYTDSGGIPMALFCPGSSKWASIDRNGVFGSFWRGIPMARGGQEMELGGRLAHLRLDRPRYAQIGPNRPFYAQISPNMLI